MAEMHITRGIQGSGKTTLSSTLAVLDGGRLVGRDHIRPLVGANGLGTQKQESEVTEIQGRLIQRALLQGQNVYVDDMNLKATYVKRLLFLANKFGADVKVHDLSHVALNTCLERNRQRQVGNGWINEDVIRSNYAKFVKPLKGQGFPEVTIPEYDAKLMPPVPYVPNTERHEAVLVDLDGTIALKGDRGFHDYDERVLTDTPNKAAVMVVQGFRAIGVRPIFVSGRKGNDVCRKATLQWIDKHVMVGVHTLFMREPHDNRADYFVKRDLFDEHIRAHWNVVGAIDDRHQVVQMYRDLGLTVFQVADGLF